MASATECLLQTNSDPLGGRVEYIYDEAQRVSAVIDQNGHPVERYAYDERGNLASLTDAQGRAETHEYDEANRRIRTTLRTGEVIGYAYDSWNRLTEVVRGDSRTHYSYDALGRLIQIDEGGVRLQYDWDSADRLVREVQDSARGYHSIEYRYDALDRRIVRTVGGRDETRYVWNKAGQIAEIHYRGEVTRYDYDAAGRLARKTLPGGSSQTYTLDAAGRLTRIEYHDRSGTLTDRLDLAHDAEGLIVRKTLLDTGLKQDSALVAEYDDANRMTRVSVSGKTWSLSYDANGNLIGKTNVADAGDATTYTWDSRNRLIALDAPGLAARFEYDPLGRRIARTVNGETTAYLYDGAQAIGEIRGAQTTTVLSGVAIDEALARYAGSGRLEQLTDHLGSVIRRIGEDGSTRSRTAYSPYGEAGTTGDAQGDGTGYTGREDDGTGLYFYRARYYDPVLGRFVSEDPIGVAGGINTYAYVEGNPLSYTDPTGECPWCVAAGIGALTDLAVQLYFNGFNLKCVNWKEVVISGAAAGLGAGIAQKLGKASTAYGGANRPTYRFFQSKGNVRVESHPISRNAPDWYSYPHWHPDFAGKPWSKMHWPLIEPAVGVPAAAYNATKDDCECQK